MSRCKFNFAFGRCGSLSQRLREDNKVDSEGYKQRQALPLVPFPCHFSQEAMRRKSDEATLKRKEQVAATAIRKVLQKAGNA